ncbi:hypothetical protein BKA70DRAFT_1278787 [Coprinopsis sp. MPI-PUGE-AT-0042]|nr:hypothetical protein BKA70DRAFT_1278787 [Coprinopsis sp. MPI-PUGE-AT-0042]
MAPRTPGPYGGDVRKLVLAFDVGTTFSGVSYCVLDPGTAPELKSVTRYPGQDHASGSSKIPSVLYYDAGGNMVAAALFKLHLRPKETEGSDAVTHHLPPLPVGKKVLQVFADFLTYLFRCARTYIQETHANGDALWESVKDSIDYVLSHPNGWEGYQQGMLRKAAVLAGLVPDDQKGHSRISFVTEGEASLHFAIRNGLPMQALEGDNGVIVVDAGGGTIDISAYTSTFQEATIPQCHFHGSVFVTVQAKLFLEDYLAESQYVDDLDHIIRCFDKTTKLRFRDRNDPQFIKFGSTRDNDPDLGIKYGQLKLKGSEVASFFAPSIHCIVDALKKVRQQSDKQLTNVVLVGGFGASDWLYHQLADSARDLGLSLYRPDHHLNKAVADGALSFYLDHLVTTRVARMTFGHRGGVTYDALNPEHFKRRHLTYVSTTSGTQRMHDYFRSIVPFNSPISETKEFKRKFYQDCKTREELATFKAKVYAYRGVVEDGFMDVDRDNYKHLCTITLNLSHLTPKQMPVKGQPGKFYYHLNYTLYIFFGGTEMKAQVGWMENVSVARFR